MLGTCSDYTKCLTVKQNHINAKYVLEHSTYLPIFTQLLYISVLICQKEKKNIFHMCMMEK